MSAQLLFAAGALLAWSGWLLVGAAVWKALQALTDAPGVHRERALRVAANFAAFAAVCLFASASIPAIREGGSAGTWRLPIVWFVMPFSAWATVACAIAAAMRVFHVTQALTDEERTGKARAAAIWAFVAVMFFALYWSDRTNKLGILTGSIPFSLTTAIGLVCLVAATMVAMALTVKSSRARGWATGAINQVALLAGSVVFGLPFAFLLVTSFKEDKDMSSPTGIIWVPRVTQTVPFNDPKNPLYETERDGQTVQGVVIEERPGGKVKVDIYKPMSIRGVSFDTDRSKLREIPRDARLVTGKLDGTTFRGFVAENLEDGSQRVLFQEPAQLKGQEHVFVQSDLEPVREIGLNWKNYPEALSYLPPETASGLVYLKNTLIIVLLSVLGTLLSSSIVSYAFSRMKFPASKPLFAVLLATMMLPTAVTLLPQFLIFRAFGWIDTLYPLWVPAFFGSAFNIFLLRQFFMNIPMELEDAAKIDGCTYLKTFWSIMLPQIKPALAVIFLWTFLAAWNNFLGPLIYINSPENMPLSYALQLFAGDRGGEPGYLTAFATLTMLPVLTIFIFFQRYFIEGVTLSGLGGR